MIKYKRAGIALIFFAVFSLLFSAPLFARYGDISKRLPSISRYTETSNSAIAVDVNNDGYIDIFIANKGLNRLLINNSLKELKDNTNLLPKIEDDSYGLAAGDVNGDGYKDIFVANKGENRLLINNQGKGFIDGTSVWLPPHSGFTTSGSFGDIDGDGYLDLVFSDSTSADSVRVLINDSNKKFIDKTAEWLPAYNAAFPQKVFLCDFNNDERPDLLVINSLYQQNRLFINDGTKFNDETPSRLPAREGCSNSAALGDVDGDGDIDILILNEGFEKDKNGQLTSEVQRNRLLINDGSGFFTDETSARLPKDSDFSFDAVFADLDGDSHPEIVVANGLRVIIDEIKKQFPNNYSQVLARFGLTANSGDVVGQKNSVYINDGNGYFKPAPSDFLEKDRNDFSRCVIAGDFYKTKGNEFFVVNSWGQKNRLYAYFPGPSVATKPKIKKQKLKNKSASNKTSSAMSDTTLSQAVTGARIQRSNEVSRAAGGMYSKTGPFEFDITPKGVKVDRDVESEINASDFADVIIQLKEPTGIAISSLNEPEHERKTEEWKKKVKGIQKDLLLQLNNIHKDKFEFLTGNPDKQPPDFKKNIADYDFIVKYIYDLTPHLAGKLTRSGFNKLKNDPNVKMIEKDRKVYASLDYSVPLINGDDVQALYVNGIELDGNGETICVIDTGVDYSHPSLGNCSLANLPDPSGEPYSLSTPHPYSNNYDNTWTITRPGWSSIAVHFSRLETEKGWDYVYILDANDTQLKLFSGHYTPRWSVSVPGDTIKIRLKTDVSVTDYGFDIDKITDSSIYDTPLWNCPKVIDGMDFVNSDDDPMDDNGHGTHVAGIAASMDLTYKGVAPGARIVAMKALDANGSGYFSDINASIQQCISWKDKYNISVITMSLGDGGEYNNPATQCDPYTPANQIKIARDNYGIITTVASGNDHYLNGINRPACASSATSVGSVYSKNWGGVGWSVCSDTATWADKISCFTNRDEILDLLAPGALITSSVLNDGFGQKGGTSMATPHVAGVAALMQQYSKKRNGAALTPDQIESTMKATGNPVTDNAGNVTPKATTGLTFPRIDAYAALNAIAPISTIPALICGSEILIDDSKVGRSGTAAWDSLTHTLSGNVTITNLDSVTFFSTKAVIYWLSDSNVSVIDSNGTYPSLTVNGHTYTNKPYYLYGNLNLSSNPNNSITKSWKFYDPFSLPFGFAAGTVAKYCN